MTVTCSVCGDDLHRGPGGFGLLSHARKHRREFRELVGRDPADYDEVRAVIGDGDFSSIDGTMIASLDDFP